MEKLKVKNYENKQKKDSNIGAYHRLYVILHGGGFFADRVRKNGKGCKRIYKN